MILSLQPTAAWDLQSKVFNSKVFNSIGYDPVPLFPTVVVVGEKALMHMMNENCKNVFDV
jgi:hypothetical protein